jgi:hypothetical protein
MVRLENRRYGSEASAEELEAIAARVEVIGDRLLFMHELPVQSPTTVDVMFRRFAELSAAWDRFAYVIDLSEAGRPDAEVRAELKARVVQLSPRVAHLAAVVGGNLLMRAMVRIVAFGMGLRSVSVHASRDEAIEEARRAVAE